jgi:hypothetical protein
VNLWVIAPFNVTRLVASFIAARASRALEKGFMMARWTQDVPSALLVTDASTMLDKFANAEVVRHRGIRGSNVVMVLHQIPAKVESLGFTITAESEFSITISLAPIVKPADVISRFQAWNFLGSIFAGRAPPFYSATLGVDFMPLVQAGASRILLSGGASATRRMWNPFFNVDAALYLTRLTNPIVFSCKRDQFLQALRMTPFNVEFGRVDDCRSLLSALSTKVQNIRQGKSNQNVD